MEGIVTQQESYIRKVIGKIPIVAINIIMPESRLSRWIDLRGAGQQALLPENEDSEFFKDKLSFNL